jgi:hypothetical protein
MRLKEIAVALARRKSFDPSLDIAMLVEDAYEYLPTLRVPMTVRVTAAIFAR